MADLADSLDEYIDSEVMDIVETEKKEFVIDNDAKADWAIRRIIKLQYKNDDAKKLAGDKISKIKEWQAGIEADNNSSIDFLIGMLRPYAEQQLEGKKKTVKLPSGNVSFRSVASTFFIAEEKADGKNKKLTAQVEQFAPQFIITEKTTNWAEFKETLTVTGTGQVVSEDGEIIEFLTAVEYPDSVTVKERK